MTKIQSTHEEGKFIAWLDQPPEQILSRWHSTGLLYEPGLTQSQLGEVGAKLAQACLNQAQTSHDGVELFWDSHPFHRARLSDKKMSSRFAILDRALSCKDFNSWFMGNMPEGHSELAMESWLSSSSYNSITNCEMQNVGRWMAKEWASKVLPKELFSERSLEEFLSVSPPGPQTQQAIRQEVIRHRKKILTEMAQVRPTPTHPRPSL